jgi:hypothetical protein
VQPASTSVVAPDRSIKSIILGCHQHPAIAHLNAFRAQSPTLFQELLGPSWKSNPAVRTQDAMPRQSTSTALGQQARHHPRPTG